MFNAKTYRRGITYTIRVTDIKANDRCFFVVYLSSQLNSSFTLIRSYWQNRHTCHISETNDDYYRINGMMLCYVKINPIWIALWIAFPLFSDKSRDLCPVEKQIDEVITDTTRMVYATSRNLQLCDDPVFILDLLSWIYLSKQNNNCNVLGTSQPCLE